MEMDKTMHGSRELEFAIFCTENVASKLNVDATKVYAALTEQTDILNDYDVPEYDIWHMMIDETQQGKGYGKAALKLILDYIEEKPFGNSDRVVLTCNKNNTYALNMYKSLGFEMTGNEDEDELELALTV